MQWRWLMDPEDGRFAASSQKLHWQLMEQELGKGGFKSEFWGGYFDIPQNQKYLSDPNKVEIAYDPNSSSYGSGWVMQDQIKKQVMDKFNSGEWQ